MSSAGLPPLHEPLLPGDEERQPRDGQRPDGGARPRAGDPQEDFQVLAVAEKQALGARGQPVQHDLLFLGEVGERGRPASPPGSPKVRATNDGSTGP